ncbi:MAG: hypothetical protein R6V36_03535 [Psychroflexus sp.]
MKYFIIICLAFFSCTDDRSLDYEDFEASPTYEVNVFQTQYSAAQINIGNDSIPNPNNIRDYIDVDFLNEQFNNDYLESLEFKFLAENSINRRQTIDFVFFDSNNSVTFRVTEPIPPGTESSPTIKSFSVVLSPQEIDIITSSIRAEFFVNQPSAATNSGDMRLECIVEAGYLFTGE